MRISEQDMLEILFPELRDPETERRRLATLARVDRLNRMIGPLTTERLQAGIPLSWFREFEFDEQPTPLLEQIS